jgi:hypothetical protein
MCEHKGEIELVKGNARFQWFTLRGLSNGILSPVSYRLRPNSEMTVMLRPLEGLYNDCFLS